MNIAKLKFLRDRTAGTSLSSIMLSCAATAGLAAAEPAKSAGAPAVAAKPMNILFLVIDDLNTWLLNEPHRYTGQVQIPNLKRFAQSAVTFTRAYAAAPICSPSRTAFLTGLAPWKSGVTQNGVKSKENPYLAKTTVLPQLLKNGGYFVASFGKVFHGYDGDVTWDRSRGHKRDALPPGAPLNGIAKAKKGATERDWGPCAIEESQMDDTKVADMAVETVKSQHTKPFFIACGLFHPHMPWYQPQRYFDMNPLGTIVPPPIKLDDLNDVPDIAKTMVAGTYQAAVENHVYEKGVQGYLAATSYADAQMGRVLDALDSGPYKDNTIVFLISDNGFHVGEKLHWQKGTLWEEATNVVMMVRVPGMTKPNQICTRVVSLLDLYPTIADLTDRTKPDYLSGRSIVHLLKDPAAPHDHPAIMDFAGHLSVRSDRYRYIQYTDGSEEFYDHNSDPHEWTNQSRNPEYQPAMKEMAAFIPPKSERAPVLQRRNDAGDGDE